MPVYSSSFNTLFFTQVWPYYTCTELICAVPREAKLFDYGFVVELIVKNYSQSLVTDVLQGTKCGEGMVCFHLNLKKSDKICV